MKVATHASQKMASAAAVQLAMNTMVLRLHAGRALATHTALMAVIVRPVQSSHHAMHVTDSKVNAADAKQDIHTTPKQKNVLHAKQAHSTQMD